MSLGRLLTIEGVPYKVKEKLVPDDKVRKGVSVWLAEPAERAETEGNTTTKPEELRVVKECQHISKSANFEEMIRTAFRTRAQVKDTITRHDVVEFLEERLIDWDLVCTTYAPGETLANYLAKAYKEIDEAAAVIRRLIAKVYLLVREGIVYLDVKPSNVVRSEMGELTLIDPDMMCFAHEKGIKGWDGNNLIYGTIEYMSPEMAMEQGYSRTSDVYSLGEIAAEILENFKDTCLLPKFRDIKGLSKPSDILYAKSMDNYFTGKEVAAIKALQNNSDMPPEVWGMAEFALHALQKNPKARPQTLEEALQMLDMKQVTCV